MCAAQRAPNGRRAKGCSAAAGVAPPQTVHFAAQLWSLLLLLSASAGLGWLLLRHGWLLRSPEQVQLTSRSPFSREQVISAAGLRFPVALLNLDGASLQQQLGSNLPVEDIRLQRQLWPPATLDRSAPEASGRPRPAANAARA